jgi:hypothetical protein
VSVSGGRKIDRRLKFASQVAASPTKRYPQTLPARYYGVSQPRRKRMAEGVTSRSRVVDYSLQRGTADRYSVDSSRLQERRAKWPELTMTPGASPRASL